MGTADEERGGLQGVSEEHRKEAVVVTRIGGRGKTLILYCAAAPEHHPAPLQPFDSSRLFQSFHSNNINNYDHDNAKKIYINPSNVSQSPRRGEAWPSSSSEVETKKMQEKRRKTHREEA